MNNKKRLFNMVRRFITYKGFDISVYNYLDFFEDVEVNYDTSSKNYYEITKGGETLLSTLDQDNKCYTLDTAIFFAKKDIDELIENEYIPYYPWRIKNNLDAQYFQ